MQMSIFGHAYIYLAKLPTQFPDLGISEAMVAAALTPTNVGRRIAASTLYPHIKRIVGLRANEQMRRIATGRIVAPVQDVEAVWNRAVSKKVNKTRCGPADSFVIELPISMNVPRGNPLPTIIGAAPVYLFPKAIFRRAQQLEPDVMAADKANRLTLDMAQLGVASFGYRRGFSAATFTKFWSIMEGHREVTFLVSNPGATRNRCPVFLRSLLV